MVILEGKYTYEELKQMTNFELDSLLRHNNEFIKLRNEMMEEQQKKAEAEQKNKRKYPTPVKYY